VILLKFCIQNFSNVCTYSVTVDLVTSPKITASLHHSVYVIADSKVIKMER